jgi:hypothetical protein
LATRPRGRVTWRRTGKQKQVGEAGAGVPDGAAQEPAAGVVLAVPGAVRFNVCDEEIITVDNCRILKNKQGALWLANAELLSPIAGRAGYEYLPVVVLSKELRRQAEDAALGAYEQWSKSRGAPAKDKGELANKTNIHGLDVTDNDVGF